MMCQRFSTFCNMMSRTMQFASRTLASVVAGIFFGSAQHRARTEF